MHNNESLVNVLEQWQKDFKNDLSEDIQKDIQNGLSLKESIDILLQEHFPIWLEEAYKEKDVELIKLYNFYLEKFKNIYETL